MLETNLQIFQSIKVEQVAVRDILGLGSLIYLRKTKFTNPRVVFAKLPLKLENFTNKPLNFQ